MSEYFQLLVAILGFTGIALMAVGWFGLVFSTVMVFFNTKPNTSITKELGFNLFLVVFRDDLVNNIGKKYQLKFLHYLKVFFIGGVFGGIAAFMQS